MNDWAFPFASNLDYEVNFWRPSSAYQKWAQNDSIVQYSRKLLEVGSNLNIFFSQFSSFPGEWKLGELHWLLENEGDRILILSLESIIKWCLAENESQPFTCTEAAPVGFTAKGIAERYFPSFMMWWALFIMAWCFVNFQFFSNHFISCHFPFSFLVSFLSVMLYVYQKVTASV